MLGTVEIKNEAKKAKRTIRQDHEVVGHALGHVVGHLMVVLVCPITDVL